MTWTAAAVYTAANLTFDQVADIAHDVRGGALYDAASGVLRVNFDVAALVDTNRGRQVSELCPGMGGCWIVETQGSHHVWDLDAQAYTRIPGLHSRSGEFAFDHQPMTISRVERWPRVGATSVLWYEDPTRPDQLECWRRSSLIVAITEIQLTATTRELGMLP